MSDLKQRVIIKTNIGEMEIWPEAKGSNPLAQLMFGLLSPNVRLEAEMDGDILVVWRYGVVDNKHLWRYILILVGTLILMRWIL